jgi:hypothetical protein
MLESDARTISIVALFLSKMSPSEKYQESIKIIHQQLQEELLLSHQQANREFQFIPATSDYAGKPAEHNPNLKINL